MSLERLGRYHWRLTCDFGCGQQVERRDIHNPKDLADWVAEAGFTPMRESGEFGHQCGHCSHADFLSVDY